MFSLTNSKPSVILFNNHFFVEAFREINKKGKLLVKKYTQACSNICKAINVNA